MRGHPKSPIGPLGHMLWFRINVSNSHKGKFGTRLGYAITSDSSGREIAVVYDDFKWSHRLLTNSKNKFLAEMLGFSIYTYLVILAYTHVGIKCSFEASWAKHATLYTFCKLFETQFWCHIDHSWSGLLSIDIYDFVEIHWESKLHFCLRILIAAEARFFKETT